MNRMLFPSDFSDVSKKAFHYTLDFARAIRSELTVLHSQASDSYVRRFLFHRWQRHQIWQNFADFCRDEQGQIPPDVSLMIRRGSLEDQIDLACQSKNFRYIAIGKDHSYRSFLPSPGSKTSRLIANTYCPVLIVPSQVHYQGISNILIVDAHYRQMENAVQENILSLGLRFQANLHYLNIHHAPASWEFSKEAFTNNQNYLVQKTIPADLAAEELLEYIREQQIDLLVMLTKRRELYEQLFRLSNERGVLPCTDLPLLVFHNNYLQTRIDPGMARPAPRESELPPAVGQVAQG
ncbi:MAG: universal stress protein [Saprospiraceae bacterium]|nr:universal stress protein [Saprospiraceae bacterium]